MKKIWIAFAGIAVIAVALAFAGFAYAQTQTPPWGDASTGYGPGMMGGWSQDGSGWTSPMMGGRWGGRGGGMMGGYGGGMMAGVVDGEYGPMHSYMLEAFAQALGTNVEDLEAQLAEGTTMWGLAEAQGLTAEEFYTVMDNAREAALDQLVADGQLTQEQADWMESRMDQMHANGFGPGTGTGFGPCHGDQDFQGESFQRGPGWRFQQPDSQ